MDFILEDSKLKLTIDSGVRPGVGTTIKPSTECYKENNQSMKNYPPGFLSF